MKAPAVVSALLLSALAAPPARAGVVELALPATGAVAPVVVPINFGNQGLGNINNLLFTLCFRQSSSPPTACDAGGSVALQEQLAPPFYLAGRFRENIATGVKTPVNFPVTLGPGQRLALFTNWVTDRLGSAQDNLVLRATPAGGTADNVTVQHTGNGVAPGPCFPGSQVLCLNNDRFKVQSKFLTSTGDTGAAGMVDLTGDTGYSFFFNSSNVEAVIKVLNACSFNNRYWVFAGGLTDVRTVITVTDTQRNAVKTYINPQGTPFQPIQDTSAFATCP
jgi:hypothetical protein